MKTSLSFGPPRQRQLLLWLVTLTAVAVELGEPGVLTEPCSTPTGCSMRSMGDFAPTGVSPERRNAGVGVSF